MLDLNKLLMQETSTGLGYGKPSYVVLQPTEYQNFHLNFSIATKW